MEPISSKGGRINEPWLCLGDLNDILLAMKKAGGQTRLYKRMKNLGTWWIIVETWDLKVLDLLGVTFMSRRKGFGSDLGKKI